MLADLKSDPGPLGLDTLLAEIGKLSTVRALGLDESVFAGASDRIVADRAVRSLLSAGISPCYLTLGLTGLTTGPEFSSLRP